MGLLDDAQPFTPFCAIDKEMLPLVMTEKPVS
jgi:hypothetical protein